MLTVEAWELAVLEECEFKVLESSHISYVLTLLPSQRI
jgi:hypothetical protein